MNYYIIKKKPQGDLTLSSIDNSIYLERLQFLFLDYNINVINLIIILIESHFIYLIFIFTYKVTKFV